MAPATPGFPSVGLYKKKPKKGVLLTMCNKRGNLRTLYEFIYKLSIDKTA